MNNVISTIIKFFVSGDKEAANRIGEVNKAAGVATRGMANLASTLGQASGQVGKYAAQASNFMAAIQQMGAIGGIIAGAQIIITNVSNYFIEQADKMAESVDRMAKKVRTRLDELNKARMDKVTQALDEATVKAKEAAAAFDALASSYLKVQNAQNATADSFGDAVISRMTLEKSRAMFNAKDKDESALVGADFDIKIAEAKAKYVKDKQDGVVDEALAEAYVREFQAKDAEKVLKKAERAKKDADKAYAKDQNSGTDRNLEKSKSLAEKADRAFEEAQNDLIRKAAEADAANERVRQAENARAVALNDATRGIIEAREAEKRLVEAQKRSAEAELERLKAVKKSTKVVEKKQSEDPRPAIESARDRFSSLFERSFDLWRDPEAAQQAQDASKKRDDDLKAFQKSVSRYGGKWRIDEAARLMREGDETVLQEKLREWRKSSKFTGQTEQMVLASAAQQNEHAAEKSLAEIAKTSGDIKSSLDTIAKAFEGSAE